MYNKITSYPNARRDLPKPDQMAQASDNGAVISFIVAKADVKRVKSALEQYPECSLLNKAKKIHKQHEGSKIEGGDELFVIPTRISVPTGGVDGEDARGRLVRKYPLLAEILPIIERIEISEDITSLQSSKPSKGGPLFEAVQSWVLLLPPELITSLGTTVGDLLSTAPTSYSIYSGMLLLTASSFQGDMWKALFSRLDASLKIQLYEAIANRFGVTHIAANSPIPLENRESNPNILRSPVNLLPLYGDFGPVCSSPPTKADFDEALWVAARQNGITQLWAPLYTMFSRGNITEKARLLSLPSVTDAIAEGKSGGRGCAVVDLYVGIGYFVFSYLKAGASKVLCWELNPWSVEGLRKGAEANKFSFQLVEGSVDLDSIAQDSGLDVIVFQESNEHAGAKLEAMRNALPPIRHVNCGLLPSSRDSWATAVRTIDPCLGGWIHLHENIATSDIEQISSEILKEICEIVRLSVADVVALEPGSNTYACDRVRLEHVERVKTYAPGIMHCVLDVYIPPKK